MLMQHHNTLCANCGGRRIAMPDDFEVQFNHTKRFTSGLELPPYR